MKCWRNVGSFKKIYFPWGSTLERQAVCWSVRRLQDHICLLPYNFKVANFHSVFPLWHRTRTRTSSGGNKQVWCPAIKCFMIMRSSVRLTPFIVRFENILCLSLLNYLYLRQVLVLQGKARYTGKSHAEKSQHTQKMGFLIGVEGTGYSNA